MPISCQSERGTNQLDAQKTAAYKMVSDAGGNRYRFYCDLSGALTCMTAPIRAETPENEVQIAWETVGRKHFKSLSQMRKIAKKGSFFCRCCGAFLTRETLYDYYRRQHSCCSGCGTVLTDDARFCPYCGVKTHQSAAGE